MATEQQLVKFQSEDLERIRAIPNTVQQASVIKPFLNLSITIKEATGMLPTAVKPKLHELYDLHSSLNMTIKDGLSTTCGAATKFIMKCSSVMKRGMNEKDEQVLDKLVKTLQCNYVGDLRKFTEKARIDLVAIQGTLMKEASGGQLQGSLKQLAESEEQLLVDAKEKTDRESEKAKNQGQIESLKYEIHICEQAIQNSAAAEKEMREELGRLKKQVPEYEKLVLEHRNTSRKEITTVLSTFLWKVRDVDADNGERIARENIDRLIERVKDLETKLNNWSAQEFEKRLDAAKTKLADVEQIQESLVSDFSKSEERYKRTAKAFEADYKEIEQIYQQLGTHNQESIKMVDTLSKGIHDATECLLAASSAIQTNLESIDMDHDLFVNSVIAAYKLITIADECNGTNKVNDIQMQLSVLNI